MQRIETPSVRLGSIPASTARTGTSTSLRSAKGHGATVSGEPGSSRHLAMSSLKLSLCIEA